MQKKIFIVLFFIIICIPSVGMIFYKTDINAEKRNIQKFPEMKKNGTINREYFDELTNYFADNFAFRQEFIEADGVMKTTLLKESNNDSVIIGKDGWLFFSETLDDYIGRNTLSAREIHACARVLYLMQENANKNGRSFLFIVAPNKNSIYGRYMPKRYIKISDNNNYNELKKVMKEEKINTVDMHDLFNKTKDNVYHKLDTHWNNQGAAMACDKILESLGKTHYNYADDKYVVENNFSGDLYGMLFPKGNKKDDNVIYAKRHTYSYLSKQNNVEDISLETENKDKDNSIIMYRDSFGNALLPFIADEYYHGYFTKAVPYNMELADIYHADTVVVEVAERHIPSLIKGIPYMAAPLRNDKIEAEQFNDCNSYLEMQDTEDKYILFSGVVDKRYISDSGEIYVRLYNEESQYLFEAFPTSVQGEKADGYHFGLYIDTSICNSGTYNIEVISQKNNKYCTAGSCMELELED